MRQSPSAQGARRHSVAIIDDMADIRLLLVTRLGLEPGIEVVAEGGTGGEAIEAVRAHHPDVVILDLGMPVMTGSEAIPVIRAIAPDTRILVFSGAAEVEDLVGAVQPDAVVHKGRDLKELVQVLQRLLSESPSDIIHLDLGNVPLAQAVAAFDSWVGLNVRIREVVSQPGRTLPPPLERLASADVVALTGVLLRLGEQLVRAAQEGSPTVNLALDIRRDVGRAAAGALRMIGSEASMAMFEDTWEYARTPAAIEALRMLYDRLTAVLP